MASTYYRLPARYFSTSTTILMIAELFVDLAIFPMLHPVCEELKAWKAMRNSQLIEASYYRTAPQKGYLTLNFSWIPEYASALGILYIKILTIYSITQIKFEEIPLFMSQIPCYSENTFLRRPKPVKRLVPGIRFCPETSPFSLLWVIPAYKKYSVNTKY